MTTNNQKMKGKRRVILASASGARKDVLERTRLKFEIAPSDYEEDMSLPMAPKKLAEFLSRGKAEAVAKKYKNAIIIAADSFIVFKNKYLGKPKDRADAKKMLKMLNGRCNSIVTGFTVIDSANNKRITKSGETKIYFKKLTESEIDNYIASGEPMGKAGAYSMSRLGAVFVKKIEGDFWNAAGLPLYDLTNVLKKFGVRII